MQFSVSSKALSVLVSNVGRVITSKNAIASLNNFLFSLEGTMLTITGLDIDNTLSGKIEVFNAEGEGKFLIDARRLTTLLKEFAEQPITFTVNDETLEMSVKSASGDYSMIGLAADQYPTYKNQTDAEGETNSFMCCGDTLLKGIDCTAFAVGTDDFRPPMMGIFLDVKPDGITFVATDTRKLVKYHSANVQPGIEASCIIHPKAAAIIKTIVAKEETITLEIASNLGILTTGTYTFVFLFIQGRFPDYNRVIPKNNDHTLMLNRKEVVSAIRRVSVFVEPGMGLVKAVAVDDGMSLKSVDTAMQTQGSENIACHYQDTEITIGLSAPYLLEIHNIIKADEVNWLLSDPSRPIVIQPVEQAEHEELTIVLMPMSIGE